MQHEVDIWNGSFFKFQFKNTIRNIILGAWEKPYKIFNYTDFRKKVLGQPLGGIGNDLRPNDYQQQTRPKVAVYLLKVYAAKQAVFIDDPEISFQCNNSCQNELGRGFD